MLNLLRGQERLAAHLHAACFCYRPARLGAFQQRPFRLGQYPDYLPYGAACRGCRVDCFSERPERHVPRF